MRLLEYYDGAIRMTNSVFCLNCVTSGLWSLLTLKPYAKGKTFSLHPEMQCLSTFYVALPTSCCCHGKWSNEGRIPLLMQGEICIVGNFVNRKWRWNCLALRGLNKCWVCHWSSTIVVAFMYAVPMVFGSALTLATFVLVKVLAHYNSCDQFFFTFFKSFQS